MPEVELFQPGDWVDWKWEPRDPDGPFAWMVKNSKLHSNTQNAVERDPIEDRLLRYEPPPYKVVRVMPVPEDELESVGHPQRVGVEMYLKPKWGGPKTKQRHFSGDLFKKVECPRR